MKRLALCIVILLLIIAIGIFELIFFSMTCDKMFEYTQQIEHEVYENEKDNAKKSIQEFSDYWEGRDKGISIIIRHEDIEKVYTYIAELDSYLENDEIGMLSANLGQINSTLEHMLESIRPTDFY